MKTNLAPFSSPTSVYCVPGEEPDTPLKDIMGDNKPPILSSLSDELNKPPVRITWANISTVGYAVVAVAIVAGQCGSMLRCSSMSLFGGSQTAPFVSYSVVVLECPGGTDKGADGHREDTAHLLKGLRAEGLEPSVLFYTDATADDVLSKASLSDAFISRVDPGIYPSCTMTSYYDFLRRLSNLGVVTFNHPDDMEAMGAKKSLLSLIGLSFAVNDTNSYRSLNEFERYFPKNLERSISAGGRVLKQNRGSKGEGVWWVQVDDGHAAPSRVTTKTVVKAVEASDNKELTMPLKTFISQICAEYFSSSGEIIDMEFLPRISEGEIRLVLTGRTVIHVVEKRPKPLSSGLGFSANLEAGAQHVWAKPEEWPQVVLPFYASLDEMLRRMQARSPPALWTADFIRAGSAHDTTFVLSEINANCVGFKAHPEMGRDLAKWVRQAVTEGKRGSSS